ncbi:hypothetical protein KDL21_13950 [Pseudomonas syringae pv. syringae]|uniref:tetratricopeptide repeat protein n=1 Tax=Pseudomonas syringae TaxID=317 RepID=UPI00233FB930|nr:hypothetical protein [Pseudomonas syringae]MDC3742136.1 hypothetical protein [Pseudomonas syringae pv. syringae]
MEIRQALHSIERHRIVWLVSEQYMGGDDFLAVLRQAQDAESQQFFRLDFSHFEGLVDELHSLQNIIVDGDINRLCEELTSAGGSYLLLDNVWFGISSETAATIVEGIKEFSHILMDFCPDLKIVVRSFLPFDVRGIKPIVLRALDEPECKNYVELHPLGKNAKRQDIESGEIHSYTGGYPERIDALLKSLAINSFESIAHGSSDESINEKATLPEAFITIFENMSNGDDYEQRKYNLLTALTFFRFGENVKTIKYFGGRQRLRPSMADDLVYVGFAEPAEMHELSSTSGEQDRFLLIKPAVQQYIHKIFGEARLIECNENAAEVYFGRDWRVGRCKLNSTFRFSSHRMSAIIEQNAALIISRLLSDAIEAEEHDLKQKNILDRVRILHYYVGRLSGSDKYLYLVKICRAQLPKLVELDDHHLVRDIRFNYARGLRMLGDYKECIVQCEALLEKKNTAELVAKIYVNMAYSYENLDEPEKARTLADSVKNMKVKGDSQYHALSILISLSDNGGKYSELSELAEKARNAGHLVSSNNMRMDVIAQLKDPLMRMAGYKKLVERARLDGDKYNMFGATINWMEIALEQRLEFTQDNADELRDAYIYACSQRQRKMFQQSHEVFWGLLERARQVEGLLQLFRYSSTLQRLTGKPKTELRYLKKLVEAIREAGLEQVSRDCDTFTFRYFAARATSYNLLSSKQLGLLQ